MLLKRRSEEKKLLRINMELKTIPILAYVYDMI